MIKGEKYWKRIVSKFLGSIVAIIIFVVPVMAKEELDVKYPSEWAMQVIMEGQNYGIYSLEWHDNFRKQISKAQIDELRKGISKKISSINGVRLKTKIIDEKIKSNTREEVLRQLFLVLQSYAYPVEIELDGMNAIDFMRENNIVSGNLKDLELNRVCTVEEAIVFGTRVMDWIYNKLDAGSKGYFWKVEGGKNKVYLLGSIHVADARLYPFNHEILEAYKTSDVVGFEIDTSDEADYNKFVDLTLYNDNSSLKDHISQDTYELLVSHKDVIGLTESQINMFKAWYLSNYISNLTLSDTEEVDAEREVADYGIDNYFLYKAYYDEKEIYPLESYELQAKIFDSFSDELQENLLLGNLYSLLNGDLSESLSEEEIKEIDDQWLTLMKSGDIQGFEEYYNTSSINLGNQALTEEYTDKLLTQRNAKMTEKIEECLSNDTGNTYFIVVGAAHYITAEGDSVIDQLRNKGYKVTQIK